MTPTPGACPPCPAAVAGADGVLRAALEEELDNLDVSLTRGDVHRRAAIRVSSHGIWGRRRRRGSRGSPPRCPMARHGTGAMPPWRLDPNKHARELHRAALNLLGNSSPR